MVDPFRRLGGFTATPAGIERRILRALPRALLAGSLLLGLPSLLVRLVAATGEPGATAALAVDIGVAALLVLHWTACLTVGLAAFIVMVMKGPAYVADAYPLLEWPDCEPGRH